MNNGAVLGAFTLLGENSHRTLGLGVMNFMNLRLTGVSLSICKLHPACSFTTDSLGSVGVFKAETTDWVVRWEEVCSFISALSVKPSCFRTSYSCGLYHLQGFWVGAADTCPFHLLVTTFFCVFILHLLGLFLTSSWLSAVPLCSDFFLLPCLKMGIPPCLDFPESTELLCLPGRD